MIKLDILKNKKHIIWDFDGTLFESYTLITNSIIYALKKQNIKSDYNDVYKKCKISLNTAIDYYSQNNDLNVELFKNDRILYENTNLKLNKPFPGVIDFLNTTVKFNISNYILTHRDYESLHECLSNYSLVQFFKDFITSNDPFPRKPNPSSLIEIINRNNIVRNEAIMIGDRNLDADCAINANIDHLLFDPNKLFYKTNYNRFNEYNEL